MLTPTASIETSFVDILPDHNDYSLRDARLDIPNPTTAVFNATLNGPPGSPVWARAWLSTEAGTLAETASPQLTAGDEVVLEVTFQGTEPPQNAYMRIESEPLKTEHVVILKLT